MPYAHTVAFNFIAFQIRWNLQRYFYSLVYANAIFKFAKFNNYHFLKFG
jgi:hypothetical protein